MIRLKYFYLLLLFILVISNNINAQINSIVHQSNKKLLINQFFYIDSSKNASFEQIQIEKKLQKINKKNFGFINYPFWIKLEFGKNINQKKFLLEVTKADTLFFYQKNIKGIWVINCNKIYKQFYIKSHNLFVF
jgi:hypothetical protein